MQDVAELLDRAATGRVLVFGSLPPECRDLDLLVDERDEQGLARALAAAGFVSRGRDWVRFAGCSAAAVDLVPVSSWGLSEAEAGLLFEEARTIEGFERLVRPAPHHALLILARIGLTEKRRRRLEAALAEDPHAWARAEQAAPERHTDLARLRRRHRLRRPRRTSGAVVALSGLYGSGKSSQAAALRDALRRLGHDAEVVWLPITANASVERASAIVRRLLRRLRFLPGLRRLDRRAEAGES